MKKLLLGSAAIALGVAGLAGVAEAGDGVKLGVSGHSKNYLSFSDQDVTTGAADVRGIEILRETEVHFSGETTLDNGLTVGAHIEADVDSGGGNNNEDFRSEEHYAYFSGAWGRVNVGKEDGAAYLLQVSAPSADSNLDGLRQYVQSVNFTQLGTTDIAALSGAGLTRFDYDNGVDGKANKVTYFTPVFNGFQAGVSYAPEADDNNEVTRGLNGANTDDVNNDYGDVYSIAARYEGEFDQLGVTFGGGYTVSELENEAVGGPLDDQTAWNLGLDLDWGPFGIGAAYLNDDLGVDTDADQKTVVVGIDYTTGPFKLGATYYDQSLSLDGLSAAAATGRYSGVLGAGITGDMDTQRFTGGVVYTYGPGLTFRGSLSFIDVELPASATDTDAEATSLLLGTQINF